MSLMFLPRENMWMGLPLVKQLRAERWGSGSVGIGKVIKCLVGLLY